VAAELENADAALQGSHLYQQTITPEDKEWSLSIREHCWIKGLLTRPTITV